jgi:hypothetical protein
VEKDSQKINMIKKHVVACHALPSCVGVKGVKRVGNEDVYCLSTSKNGNFIANGMVIKNCDALRYSIFSHFFGKESSRMSPQDLDRNYYEAMGGGNELPAPFRDMQTGGYG